MRSTVVLFLLFGCSFSLIADDAAVEVSSPTNATSVKTLTLEGAMSMAADRNPDIAIQKAAVVEAREQRGIAGGRMGPQLYADARVHQIDDDRSGAKGLGAPERDTRIGLRLSQTLYDESLRAGIKVSDRATQRALLEEQQSRLDAMHEAGLDFLQFLLARSLREIAADNLKLTLDHLTLARNRNKLGAAGIDEVFRFEAEEARQRGHLIGAESNIDKARIVLNHVMGADAEATWAPQQIKLDDGSIYFLDDAKLGGFLAGGPDRVDRFRAFSAIKALESAPELRALDEAIAAQRIVIEQKRRAYYMPEVSASAAFDRIVSQQYALSEPSSDLSGPGFPISRPDDNEWQVGIVASLPLYEGGARKHDVGMAAAQLAGLEQTRAKVARQIGQRVRTAVYDMVASYKQIAFAHTAADRARRSQEIVNDKYTRGAAQIIEVLDAQNEALVEKIGAANALNKYLQHVVEYQRSIAWFDKFQTRESRAAWVNHFNRFTAQPDGKPPGLPVTP